jgi:hypothetical protein
MTGRRALAAAGVIVVLLVYFAARSRRPAPAPRPPALAAPAPAPAAPLEPLRQALAAPPVIPPTLRVADDNALPPDVARALAQSSPEPLLAPEIIVEAEPANDRDGFRPLGNEPLVAPEIRVEAKAAPRGRTPASDEPLVAPTVITVP